MKNYKKIEVNWGGGTSDMFLLIEDGTPKVINYRWEKDQNILHDLRGGKVYYQSRTGASGAGYIRGYGDLVPLGKYRPDTTYNDHYFFESVGKTPDGEDIMVAVPSFLHYGREASGFPSVIKVGYTLVYCDFKENFAGIVKDLLTGKDLSDKFRIRGVDYNNCHKTLRREFSCLDEEGGHCQEEVEIEFYNLWLGHSPNPWEFFREELHKFRASGTYERMFQLLSVERLEDGTFVRTFRVDDVRYSGAVLDGNPLEGDLIAGWERVDDDIIVRYYDNSNEVHIVAYEEASTAYRKVAERFARRIGEGEDFVEDFLDWISGEYVEYEMKVSKVLYALDPGEAIAELRKGLARKVRDDIAYFARQRIDELDEKDLLESVPDDLVVTFDDSLEAGNCRPGTEDFVQEHFPGQSETTAKELKKYADNRNVVRIFRHLAAQGKFSLKTKLA